MYNERKFIVKILTKNTKTTEITIFAPIEQTFTPCDTKKHFTIYYFWCMLVVETNKFLKGGCFYDKN